MNHDELPDDPFTQGARALRVAVVALFVALFVVLLAVAGSLYLVGRVGDEGQARRADISASNEDTCHRVNELPAKIAKAIAISDRLRQLTGATTTTTPAADLTPAQRAEVDQLRRDLNELTRDLGSASNCAARPRS